MLEVYLLVALGSLGYYLARNGGSGASPMALSNSSTVSTTPPDVYNSNRLGEVQKQEEEAATVAWSQAQAALKKRERDAAMASIPPAVMATSNPQNNIVRSQLAGIDMASTEFQHNNMTPFFGGSIKQNTNLGSSLPVLERFTGTSSDTPRDWRKREQAPMFAMARDIGNPYGMATSVNLELERMKPSRIQNNVLPFKQVKDAAKPLRYDDVVNNMLPKNVDALRVASKPKITYDGLLIESGLRGTKRADAPDKIDKNRPETFMKLSKDHLFRTTGAYLKETQRPAMCATDKPTSRAETGKKGHMGTPGAAASQGSGQRIVDPTSYAPGSRQQLSATGLRNAIASAIGMGTATDYGKGSIQVYDNNRQVTSVRTYQGGITTVVKALVAPITDILAPTKKDSLADAARQFGNLQSAAGMPSKIPIGPTDVMRTTIKEAMLAPSVPINLKGSRNATTVHDPSSTARVTIKETTLAPTVNTNLRGPTRVTVYDPLDVARATMKETILAPSVQTNLHGGRGAGVVYDPDSVLRTTTKETTLAHSEPVNMKSVRMAQSVHDPTSIARTTLKQTTLAPTEPLNMRSTSRAAGPAFDPNAIARTTLKETMLSQSQGGFLSSGQVQGPAEADDLARTTVRQTLDEPSTVTNMRPVRQAGSARDTNDTARTTLKEVVLKETSEADGGHIGGLQGRRGGYIEANIEAKDTQRQEYDDEDRFGGADAKGNGDGYLVSNVNAKDTQRQETDEQGEYFGTGADQSRHVPKSYSDMYAATINELKEETLVGRDPTNSGPKVAAGKENIEGSVHLRRNTDVKYDITEMWSDDHIEKDTDITERMGERTRYGRTDYKEPERGGSTAEAAVVGSQLSKNPYALRGPALQQAEDATDQYDDFFDGFE